MNAPVKVLPRNLNMPRPRVQGVGNGSAAPICPVSKSQALPGGPGPLIPIPPPAVDLPSAIQVLNQIRQIVIMLTNPPNNMNLSIRIPQLIPQWHETNRKMVTQRVFNPLDSSMWVDVEHIAMMEMTDKMTGAMMQLLYNLPKLGGVGTAPTTGGTTIPNGPGGPALPPGQ